VADSQTKEQFKATTIARVCAGSAFFRRPAAPYLSGSSFDEVVTHDSILSPEESGKNHL